MKEKTEHCGKELKQSVWRKLEIMGHEAEEFCIDEMNTCVTTFENIGN